MLSEEQLQSLMQRVRRHGQEAEEQLEGVFDDPEPPTPSRSNARKGSKAASSLLTSTAKTGRRRPAAVRAASSSLDDSADANAPQVRTTAGASGNMHDDIVC